MTLSLKYFGFILSISLLLSSCSTIHMKSNTIDFHKDTYYFAAGFENGGLDFYTQEPIKSLSEFTEVKNNFIKMTPGYDRYYYKFDGDNNTLYAYSLLTNNIQSIMKLDNQKRLHSKEDFKNMHKVIQCTRTYMQKSKVMIAKEICTNDETHILHYTYNKKYHMYVHNKTDFYKKYTLIESYKFNENGIVSVLDSHGNLKSTHKWMAESDGIPIFKN